MHLTEWWDSEEQKEERGFHEQITEGRKWKPFKGEENAYHFKTGLQEGELKQSIN